MRSQNRKNFRRNTLKNHYFVYLASFFLHIQKSTPYTKSYFDQKCCAVVFFFIVQHCIFSATVFEKKIKKNRHVNKKKTLLNRNNIGYIPNLNYISENPRRS